MNSSRKILMKSFSKLVLIFAPIIMSTCAAEKQGIASCKRDCTKAILATADTNITPISSDVSVLCEDGEALHPAEVIFRATSKDGNSIGNILFEPIFNGVYDPEKNFNAQFEKKYSGLETPTKEWCSDSCGIIKLTIWVSCSSSSSHSLYLTSGAMTDIPKVTISTEEINEEESD